MDILKRLKEIQILLSGRDAVLTPEVIADIVSRIEFAIEYIEKQEPVAWARFEDATILSLTQSRKVADYWEGVPDTIAQPLFPIPLKLREMSDEEINKIFDVNAAAYRNGNEQDEILSFARAIIAAAQEGK